MDRVERPKQLLDRVCDAIRLKHYSDRTEQTYVDWIHRFILFLNKVAEASDRWFSLFCDCL
ncbi:MAG: phage integrase N-terminal SAM-like domain-containing protein [Aphanocapsa sp. GSE-SYN-MK-11-07L]|nr:phage integrase N-terminal SAM-like domain-containing protein [Aphanocapsa sp. GSE-SYN-MK-11-07L]